MEEEKDLPREDAPAEQEQVKSPWQIQKESWYDKIPLNLKQLDTIIVICWILLVLTGIAVYLDAADIFHLFG